MVTIRSVNEIILSLIDFYRLSQPDLDTKPGTVARDLFIEAPAAQLSLLYEELSNISSLQSFRLVVGSDLDKLAKNFGQVRKSAKPSTGVALYTFSSIEAPISINKGDIVTSYNGLSFSVLSSILVNPKTINFYKSVATKYRDQLDTIGISDLYAVEVTLNSVSAGAIGNISKYALNKSSTPGVSNVTNLNQFVGGTDQEDDLTFRNRILSAFNGSSIGTSLGYLNTALSTTNVTDAVVIEPGNPLMTRDGTDVLINADGSRTIISEGSGGKIDVIIMGQSLLENSESFIYKDKSNNNDPTSSKNDIVLGQISGDENKTINRKRIDNIKNGQLPIQPVSNIIKVSGSLSGSNFKNKTIDELGRISGNYELIKDTSDYSGSPWGFDKFHWISNMIDLSGEDKVKGQYNGYDALSFIDVNNISYIQQSISISNENSTVTYDRSIIQLLHTPVNNVTRAFNVNTGERYIITNQNLDEGFPYNETGRIKISGNTLPSPSDILQVDYNWIVKFDNNSDYDGLLGTNNLRSITDSIDWGYSSLIRNERITFSNNGDYYIGASSHPISSIIEVKSFKEFRGVIYRITSGIFANRLGVLINSSRDSASEINSISFYNGGKNELYKTTQNNGVFTNTAFVVGVNTLYNISIVLPTDTLAQENDIVNIIINETDVYTNGSFNGSQITIPSGSFTSSNIDFRVSYIAFITDLYSSAISVLPANRSSNGFKLFNGLSNFSPVNLYYREYNVVQKNLSNQYYIQLPFLNTSYSLTEDQVLAIIRLSDNGILWNKEYPGTVTISDDNYYQLILSGFSAPNINDRCLVITGITDSSKYQPFSYENNFIKFRVDELLIDPSTNRGFVLLNKFSDEISGLKFEIMNKEDDTILFTIDDGYLNNNTTYAKIGSNNDGYITLCYNAVPDLLNKRLRITLANDLINNGIYDIVSYDLGAQTISIKNYYDQLTKDQISVIRILDGQEIWNYDGDIQISNNRVLLASNPNISSGDSICIFLFNYSNLRQSPTKLISTISDQVNNVGVLSIIGTTLNKVEDVIFTATQNGLSHNLLEAARKVVSSSVIDQIKLAKLIKLEKVQITVSNNVEEVISVLSTYDTLGSTIKNNLLYSNDMFSDFSKLNLAFTLPETINNINNAPKIGDKLRATFYYSLDNDSESLSYTKIGGLYTNKKFALIDKILISSGFKSSQSTRLNLTSFTQPSLGARYKVNYSYMAPKQNERISIQYNYNNNVTEATFNVESSRPINADVLVKEASLILLDLTINVVISNDFLNSSDTIIQNVKNALITAMTATSLGSIIDEVTLINVTQSIEGVSRARILYFNKTGLSGQVTKIQAQDNEYFAPNNITINQETR